MRIGVFDSGAGGLTVAKFLIASRLFSEIVYFGDTARVPYGNKDAKTVVRYSLEALEFFDPREIELLVVACNTVSVTAIEELRRVARYPVIGVVEPAIWLLDRIAARKSEKVLIIGTNVTVSSNVYQHAVYDCGFRNVQAIATGLLVSLVEEGVFDGPVVDAALEHYFGSIDAPDIIVLACTHFPLLSCAIAGRFPHALLIHSGEAIAEWLRFSKYTSEPMTFETTLEIFASDDLDRLKNTAIKWLGDYASRLTACAC